MHNDVAADLIHQEIVPDKPTSQNQTLASTKVALGCRNTRMLNNTVEMKKQPQANVS